jgi:hypothetical protein
MSFWYVENFTVPFNGPGVVFITLTSSSAERKLPNSTPKQKSEESKWPGCWTKGCLCNASKPNTLAS